MNVKKLIRPLVQALSPYVPGEQPKIQGLVKLNTNENPYPPSPKVLRAIQAAVDQRLRLYPNPTAQALREALANLHGCQADSVTIGNGSDEVLALAIRAFVEPSAGQPKTPAGAARSTVQFFDPSYSLYPVLAETHGAKSNPVPLAGDFAIPSKAALKAGKRWNFNAALTLVTTPNAPSGRGYSLAELDALCAAQKGVVLLDEAYVDFAAGNAMSLALKHPHVLVARTFSKAYSLCFQRVGYAVGNPELIAAIDKVRDSYNVNGLGQIAALATLGDLPYYQKRFRQIIATRARLGAALEALGFQVLPSETNFLLAKPPGPPAEQWLQLLRARKILVRWFHYPSVRDYIRVTIGADSEADALIRAAKAILRARKA